MKDTPAFTRPPLPPRETARTRRALPVRIDAGLVSAFHETRKRLGLGQSEMMEIILWNALDKPPLSFEPEYAEKITPERSS